MHDYLSDKRFKGITPFEKRVVLASPTMHRTVDGNSWVELEYIKEAFETGWITCAGSNLEALEPIMAKYIGSKYAVALSNGTSAIHLAIKLASKKIYGSSSGILTPDGPGTGGCIYGRKVFCSDFTFDATVNPVLYEGGEPVLIDSEYETWNMDPEALEKAFDLNPDVKLVIMAHLYGTPGKADEIKSICEKHGALLIEDAAESLGATYKGKQTGVFGDIGVISFNGNKLITGSAGGALICSDEEDADLVRKWSTQSREAAPWYQHKELGYNYRMSNINAGIIRGQFEFIDEHIAKKKEIFKRYEAGLKDLPLTMNPSEDYDRIPNYWLSSIVIDNDAMEDFERSDGDAKYTIKSGKSCPSEILDALDAFNAEGRPIWKPMHMQPIYQNNPFVSLRGNADLSNDMSVSKEIFNRGVCLPSDIKMVEEEQNRVIEIIRRCFS